ncbi:ADP-ribosylation factor-like protein 11 [Huso huso]|uniref:ADP-ribosylation factor-like protein 11 n=1 Tax=Huso huso TaxID=61971 RepID=A0ABR0ZLM5_HUSHU|nr:ADP-ribosylation factor-like protein 11 [Acipenser ruthenus]
MGTASSRGAHKRSSRVLLMGLDSAGKSTLLYKLKLNRTVQTSPTIGFNVEMLELEKQLSLTVWDVGGQDQMRPNWKHFLEDSDGLVFVVDSTDEARLEEAKKELKRVLKHDSMKEIPLMVLANKQDVPSSLSIREIALRLNLMSYENRDWEIQGCSAYTGEGLKQAFRSVSELIRTK